MMDGHGEDNEKDGHADADGAEWHVLAISLIDLPRHCQAKQSIEEIILV